MRPYVGKRLDYLKRILNYRLSRARRYIECTFGIMANKWGIFHRPLNVSLELAERIVLVCTVLHNCVWCRYGYRYEDTLMRHLLLCGQVTVPQQDVYAKQVRDRFAHNFIKEGHDLGRTKCNMYCIESTCILKFNIFFFTTLYSMYKNTQCTN